MNSPYAAEVVRQIRNLPALPLVVTELVSTLEQEDVNVRVLADKIALDQALAAKTLRLANSSFYGMQSQVTTIQQAISILGFSSVRTLVTAAAVLDNFPVSSTAGFNFPAFWRHSIGAALCAKSLARQLQINQDSAFVAGLLHDIGRLVLIMHAPANYAEVSARKAELDCYPLEAEQAILGLDHTQVGAALAEHWKFPHRMQNAILHHHAPDDPGADALATLIHVADCIAHALDLSGDERDLVPPISAQAWDCINLDHSALAKVYRETETQFEEACKVLISTRMQ